MATQEPLAIMTGTPDTNRPTLPEYERITDATASVLSRFDWITKVRVASDAGTLLAALGMWGMRVYVIWVMKHPEQGFSFPNPFARRKQDQPAPQEMQADPEQNGKPTPLDFGSIGLGQVQDLGAPPD